jgi:hypothetical protein
MSDELPLSLHRRIKRRWAKSTTPLRQISGQVVLATERTLRRMFNRDGSLVPIAVRAVVDRPPIRLQSRD